ncbi:MAG TPA: hypothetical protein VIX81_10115 [Gammaproteobacteria bacterium]
MSAVPPLAFALTRIHARHARLPTALDWRRLGEARDRTDCLLQARGTGLRPWLRNVADSDSVDEVEIKLRASQRRYLAEVAGWLAPAWRPATLWLGRLTDLAPLEYLRQGGNPLPWMELDPALAPWVRPGEPRPSGTGLTDPAPLLAHPERDPADAWRGHWLSLWPGSCPPQAGPLAGALANVAVAGSPAARARLLSVFRGTPLHVAALFAHLGLFTDDLRRLAGELARRLPRMLVDEAA